MPPPNSGPALSVSCYYGNADEVEALLRAGADPLKFYAKPPLHEACLFAHVGCVRALAARDDAWVQLDYCYGSAYGGGSPLVGLCRRAGSVTRFNPNQLADTLQCARLLLEAGCSLELRDDKGKTALDLARLARTEETAGGQRHAMAHRLVHMLEEAEALQYSRATHDRFPRPARAFAAFLLRIGHRVARGALVPVWTDHVLPLLLTRTSRVVAPFREVNPTARPPGTVAERGTLGRGHISSREAPWRERHPHAETWERIVLDTVLVRSFLP